MSVQTTTQIPGLPTIERGRVLLPGTDRYEAARSRNTPEQYPAAIVEARDATDIRAGVLTARDLDRPLAVRATGHGSVRAADGAVLISTASMTGVAVDPVQRVARIAPGTRWAEVIAATEPYGLSPTSGDFPGVGVAGFTTGGGVGWLARRYGYAADNLLAARLVLADGRTVTADPDRHPDLFWAIRGGSGNFGVITELTLRLAPVDRVLAGTLTWPIDVAPAVLRWFAESADRIPDDVTLAPVLRAADAGTGAPMLRIGVVGLAEDPTRAVLTELRRVAGTDGAGSVGSTRYAQISIPGTRPRAFELYDELGPGLVDDAVEAVATGRADALEFHHWGGATARPAVDHGPVGHRDLPFSIKIDAGPSTAADLARRATGAAFLNFLADTSRTARAYKITDYYRLRELKRRYDPTNLFRVNHNIPPA